MYFKVCLIVSALLCFRYCAMAASVDELKLMYVNYILECAKEYPVSTDDILAMKNNEIHQSRNVKCLLACTYKKTGAMDEEGKLSVEGIRKHANDVFAEQPELRQRSEIFAEACKFVNDEEITGDEKECERAAMIFKCSVDNAAKLHGV